MALWHYKFELVPPGTDEPTIKSITSDGFIPEVEVNWENDGIGKSTLEFIKSRLEPTKSWSDEILMFGSKENRIDVGFDEETGEVEYVNGQFDLRDDKWKSFISEIICIAEKSHLRIYDFYTFNIFKPTIENFHISIIGSNGYKALTNPDEFFKNLEKNQKT